MVHTDSQWETAQKVVEDALKNTEYASEGLERLGGGFINFAFRNRLTGEIEGYGQTVVVKLTDDKVKGEFTLHKVRSYYEHHVLAQPIPSFCSADGTDEALRTVVRVPKVLDYFPNDHIQIIENLPDTMTLKAHLLNQHFHPAFAISCGRAIGGWAAKFHAWGRHPNQEALRKALSSYTEARQFKFRLSCGRLEATIEKFPDMLGNKMPLFKKVSERVVLFAQGDGAEIIHGDFWPGNLVFATSANGVFGDTTSSDYDVQADQKQIIFVLDWELCHLSSFVIDLGTMFAELYLLYFFKDSSSVRLILDSFLEAYGPIEKHDVLNVMIWCGVHLIIWPPRTEWSGHPRLKECVQYGCDILENAYNGNTELFEKGFFQKLFYA